MNTDSHVADGPSRIPDSHPRAASLRTRERMKDAVRDGLVHPTGLIAHGRGEAFDYLLGERTPPEALEAIAEAARRLREAKRPVLSLNGNVVALAAKQCADLQAAWPALRLEVNLFHRTPERVERLVAAMEAAGAREVLGRNPDARIPGLESDRAQCCKDGIGGADVVLVPLEDGDRCEALRAMGKTVLTIDLNPLSRTARTAHVTIVDELTRVLPLLAQALQGGVTPASPASAREQGGREASPPAHKAAFREASSAPVRGDAPNPAYDNEDVLRRVKARMAQHLG
jgi:4-phosphopantoate---beta-alanine ligase